MASSRILSMFSRRIRPRQFIREFSYYSFLIISWVPAAVFFNEHVGQLSWIHGPSMYPYLNADFNQGLTEDMCWVNKWGPTENLQRGMIVAFR